MSFPFGHHSGQAVQQLRAENQLRRKFLVVNFFSIFFYGGYCVHLDLQSLPAEELGIGRPRQDI